MRFGPSQKSLVIAFLVLCSTNVFYAQKTEDYSPKATKMAKLKQYFFAGVEASKSAIDWKDTDFEIRKKVRYPKALNCYVRKT